MSYSYFHFSSSRTLNLNNNASSLFILAIALVYVGELFPFRLASAEIKSRTNILSIFFISAYRIQTYRLKINYFAFVAASDEVKREIKEDRLEGGDSFGDYVKTKKGVAL